MKKQIIALAAVIVLQTSFTVAEAKSGSVSYKRAEISKTLPGGTVDEGPVNVSSYLEKRFRKQFPAASLEEWYTTSKGFVVHFRDNDVQSVAFLDRKGNVHGQISYYGEKQLPLNVRQEVRSNYYDYSIRSVTEVNVKKAKVYLVNIEDKTSWKTIRVSDEGMEVYEEHIKD